MGAGQLRSAARAFWRWLTSMRTALLLLLALAIAAVPGSLLPQRDLEPEQVDAYLARHPRAGAWLDRLWAFEVFASPWFSAIYLLLFVSLVGCLVPRLRQHLAALVARPPDAPARLHRLPYSAVDLRQAGDPGVAAAGLGAVLRRQRWRVTVREHDGATFTVAAEKGYLKETGNLAFHFALLAILTGVALGSWYGWHGNRLVVAGADTGFCNTLAQYDEHRLGPRVDPADLAPFCLRLDAFHARYLASGQPVGFTADVTYQAGDAGVLDPAERGHRLEVNHPLRLSGANVYLLGHGYAPVLRYTDRYGQGQTKVAPFLTDDEVLTGSGVATFPDANLDPAGPGTHGPPAQTAFAGVYLPTLPADPAAGRSAFPAELNPALMLVAYQGDLGLDAGVPQSVYQLDRRQIDAGRLREVGRTMLRPGQRWTLPDGSAVQFLGTRPWVTVSVRHDPGETIVLVGAGTLLAGLMLSLTGRRRRLWARLTPAGGGGSLISLGGLARSDYPGFADEFTRVVALTGGDRQQAPSPVAVGQPQ